MLTGKQRSFLRGLANKEKPITQIGKAGLTVSFLEQLDLALESRELVKVTILETALLDTKDTANEAAELLKAEYVQAIGNKFVLFRRSKNNPRIELPRPKK
ncbi:YhbY family RNA-binding protein [Alkaliphilus hydrothermalis]|uniref:RNA-binding protein n=1 Tax=Alkaliphilus hydrothermalis TaxID=1482730 RepID=A0ABS2NS89_9FIRM|nr:YhbY family RNA-binding protein [Alkaliphilus hydrothermalis]MBM7615830.1 RNA-binding protein [Alkaliphilus hydrothermalis]